jgi:hypothetical protein
MSCRIPPPWTIEENNNACFLVRDANKQALAYIYFEKEPGRRSAAKLLTKDEARRMSANFAKLPERLRRSTSSLERSRHSEHGVHEPCHLSCRASFDQQPGFK